MKYYSLQDIVNFLKNGKFTLMISIVISLVLGLTLYTFTPNVYGSKVKFLLVGGENDMQSKLSGFASLTGLTTGMNKGINVFAYKSIVESPGFLAEVVATPLFYHGDSIFYGNYLAQRMQPRFMDKVKRANSGQKGKVKKNVQILEDYQKYFDNPFSPKPFDISGELASSIGILRNIIVYSYDEKANVVEISIEAEDPYISASLAKVVYDTFEKFVRSYSLSSNDSQNEFLEREYKRAKNSLDSKRLQLASQKDAGINANRARTNVDIDRLNVEYQEALRFYTEISGQKKMMEISKERSKDLFLLLESPQIRNVKSQSYPRISMFIAGSIILGIAIGLGILSLRSFITNNFKNS